MPKLTQAQIREKADEWARLCAQIEKATAAYDAEIEPILSRQLAETLKLEQAHAAVLEPYAGVHEPKIERLQGKADAIKAEILEWLGSQKKSIIITGAKTIAEFFKGTKKGVNRVVDPEKFVNLCLKRKIKKFWTAVKITLKDAEPMVGKNDLDAISGKPDLEVEEASLKLK